ncbi:MAG: transporter ATP-binding protein [Firmicutes bacterium]|nr:transporter ATP-binding protein [Bacillota bacterium]
MKFINKSFCKGLWQLFKGYWNSEEKWKARGLLGSVIALNFIAVYIAVLINQWSNSFYNALQNYDQAAFWDLIGQFAILAFLHIIVAVYAMYLRQMLQIKWRKWMTNRYLDKWLHNQTYYKMQILEDKTDNPDQRISEDIDQFVSLTLSLSLGFLKQITMLGAFIAILWELSGVITLPIGSNQITIYGYMVWISILYAAIGTYLTAKIGNPLVRLNYDQQRYEANFRFNMVRLRENSESVAFYGGEKPEKAGLLVRFEQVFKNYWDLMKYGKRLTWFTSGYGQLAIIFPLLMAAPRYFSGAMQLGGLMQTARAFGNVQDALSFFVDSYTTIAQWQAVVKRLLGFVEHMQTVEGLKVDTNIVEVNMASLAIKNLTVALPNGQTLLQDVNLQVSGGEKLLITGASGCGKSTFMRTISGIWPFGKGSIVIPQGQIRLFLPQRPYLPLGSLKEAILYPKENLHVDDERIKEVMKACQLGVFISKLNDADDWSRILSLGEQQRLAFARVLLIKPEWVFLDEATSALDEPTEKVMYDLLVEHLPNTAIISIGHRNTLVNYHQKKLHLSGDGNWAMEMI